MNLGEVRVDRTSVAYLVHAVRGGWLTAFGEGETARSSPRSGKGNGPEPTTFGEGERSGGLHVRGVGTVRSSPRPCLMLGTVGLGLTHPLTDRAQKCARAGRPTPCPLSLAAGRRPPQSGKEKRLEVKITSPQGIVPAPGWIVSAGLRRKSQWRGRPGFVGSPLRPAPETPPVLPSVGTAEGAGERRDRARPL